MAIFARVPLEKVMPHMQTSGKRELVWYGITIGQIGFGVLASVKRQPTPPALDFPETWAENEHPSACVHRKACIFYKPASQ